MTFEERLAALGVETSDFVPSDEHCKNLYDKFYAEAKCICKLMGAKLDGPFMVSLLLVAVAKRDIIIDRMETRLVNLTGELDWLRIKCCDICGLRPEYGEEVCESCDVNRGVSTNWRPRSEPTRTNEEASPAVPDLTKTKE